MIVLRGGSQVKEIEVGVREVKWRFVGGLITGLAEKILNILIKIIMLYLCYVICYKVPVVAVRLKGSLRALPFRV